MVKASGSFTVTASQAGDSTYAVAPDVTETLNVGKLSQTIAFSPITDKSIGDFDFDPGATSGSGLPVTYTSSAPLIASVEGTTAGSQKIKVRAAGTVTITASQAGDSAYDPAPDANQTFTVGYYNLFSDSLPGLSYGLMVIVWIVIIHQQIPLPMEQRSGHGKTALQAPIMQRREPQQIVQLTRLMD